jgi:hypothetical protein
MISVLPFLAVTVFAFWVLLRLSDFISELIEESRK